MGAELAGNNGHTNGVVGPTQPFIASVDTQSPSTEPNATKPEGSLPPVSAQLRDPGLGGEMAALLTSAGHSIEDLSKEFPRSVAAGYGPSRWLRMLIGVDETLLARVWEERPRYTGLGAIVLGTAAMAAFSMFDAVTEAIGPVWSAAIPVALFWAVFICCIDRWLISSTHGTRSARWRIFVPRLLLSLIFGVIIATPLVLTIFGPEVVTRAATDQQNQLTQYESLLKHCNPLPDQVTGTVPPAPASCGENALPVKDPAVGLTQTLAREKQQAAMLTRQISGANAIIAKYDQTIRDECNGVSGPGLSGISGIGPNCDRDRQQEAAFEAQNPVRQWQQQLNTLNGAIGPQSTTVGNQLQAYSDDITRAVNAKIAAREHSQGRIGLLGRIGALGELFASSVVIATATVLLGVFVLLVDCLPVLSKMMSGTTNYDRLVDGRLRSAEVIATAAIRVSERRATGTDEVALHAVEGQIRAHLEQIDEASRVERGRRDAEVDRKIAELTEEFRRIGPYGGNA